MSAPVDHCFSPTLVLSESDDDGSITPTLWLKEHAAGAIKVYFLPGPVIPGTKELFGFALADWRHSSLQHIYPFSRWHKELEVDNDDGVVELDFTQYGGMLKYICCLTESHRRATSVHYQAAIGEHSALLLAS